MNGDKLLAKIKKKKKKESLHGLMFSICRLRGLHLYPNTAFHHIIRCVQKRFEEFVYDPFLCFVFVFLSLSCPESCMRLGTSAV